MVDAEEHLARFGTVIKSPSGYPIQSPYLSIANRAIKQIAKPAHNCDGAKWSAE